MRWCVKSTNCVVSRVMSKTKYRSLVLVGVAGITLLASIGARAQQWFFFVQNDSSSKIIKLEAKESGGSWSSFRLSGGIRPGERTKIVWAESTNNQGCEQYLRATFADGSKSSPKVFDFCKDLNEPIIYTD